jgi:natural product biosynthesis luciferase-like monooxygenase protein
MGMRFGILTICDNDPAQRSTEQFYRELIDQIVLAEDLGFEDYWVAEHHYSNYGVVPSPALILAAAASRTTRIGLGSGVSILPFRDPMQVAEDYAMVDLLSNGRLTFGVGRGFLLHEYKAFGIANQAASKERFDEALAIIRKAWEGERFSFHGKHHSIDNLQINVTPVQKPAPPIYLAALSPSSYEKAAAAGVPVTGVATSLRTLDRIAERVSAFKNNWSDAGRDPNEVDVPMAFYTCVVRDQHRVYEDAGRYLIDYFRSIGDIFDPDAVDDPEARGVYKELHEWNNTVTYDHVEEHTDVAIFGDPATVINKLEKIRDAGVDKVQCVMNFGNLSHDAVAASMELFAKEVMPELAENPR